MEIVEQKSTEVNKKVYLIDLADILPNKIGLVKKIVDRLNNKKLLSTYSKPYTYKIVSTNLSSRLDKETLDLNVYKELMLMRIEHIEQQKELKELEELALI